MYNASLKYKWDNKNVRDYAAEKGREEGLEQGLKEGLEKGEHKRAVEMALQMLSEKEPLDKIAKYTKLSIEEIGAL